MLYIIYHKSCLCLCHVVYCSIYWCRILALDRMLWKGTPLSSRAGFRLLSAHICRPHHWHTDWEIWSLKIITEGLVKACKSRANPKYISHTATASPHMATAKKKRLARSLPRWSHPWVARGGFEEHMRKPRGESSLIGMDLATNKCWTIQSEAHPAALGDCS